jgi:outer membrane protein OmpA-like peptidoglycan-associated protein
MRFFVIDKESGQPIEDIVIKMTAPDGEAYYTWPTDSVGYGEVLVPAGQSYELEYLSLGHRNVTARVDVPDEPNQDLKLTLRFKRYRPPEPAGPEEGDRAPDAGEPRVVLEGVRFDTGQATLRPESLPRLDRVVEYLSHKPSARLRVAGHTDNVGRAEANRELSQRRAEAVRDYLVDQGIDGVRIEAVGYGAERPIAPNDTEEGRQKNRRIEAVELRDGQ